MVQYSGKFEGNNDYCLSMDVPVHSNTGMADIEQNLDPANKLLGCMGSCPHCETGYGRCWRNVKIVHVINLF